MVRSIIWICQGRKFFTVKMRQTNPARFTWLQTCYTHTSFHPKSLKIVNSTNQPNKIISSWAEIKFYHEEWRGREFAYKHIRWNNKLPIQCLKFYFKTNLFLWIISGFANVIAVCYRRSVFTAFIGNTSLNISVLVPFQNLFQAIKSRVAILIFALVHSGIIHRQRVRSVKLDGPWRWRSDRPVQFS